MWIKWEVGSVRHFTFKNETVEIGRAMYFHISSVEGIESDAKKQTNPAGGGVSM